MHEFDPAHLKQLEQIIGYEFKTHDRLKRALTHSSARQQNPQDSDKGNYERLEFLGDRVLGLCIAQMLFQRFSDAAEGELSVRLNNLVSAEACALVADDLKLHKFIKTGSDVKNITGVRMHSVRADVIEALIAAIYLDGGLRAANQFITKFWSSRADQDIAVRRDAKTELQEWAHAKYKMTPQYKVRDRTGPDHDPIFSVEVMIGKLVPVLGQSRSKRAAEQAAATNMLLREGVWTEE